MTKMTDEELIERLRGWMTSTSFDDDAHAAADRIEQLVVEVNEIHEEAMETIKIWGAALKGKYEAETKLAKAVKLIGYAIELGRFELNPKLLDDLIHFKTEIELEKTE